MDSAWDILRDPNCTRCDLYKNAQSVCLIGRGPYPNDLMLVGEAPGYREDDIGKPFSGKAGKLLTRILESIGLDREELYISNAVHCRPVEKRNNKNATPLKHQILACRYFLLKEIELVKPKKMILLGRTAMKGLFKDFDTTIEKARRVEYDFEGIKVYVTYHPSAALHRPYLRKVIRSDIMEYLNLNTKKKIEIDYKDLESKKEYFNFSKPTAIDIESTGLEFFRPDFKLICMSASDKAGKSRFDGNPLSHRKTIRAFIDNPQVIKIGHNLKFDLKAMLKEKMATETKLIRNSFFDTLIAFNVLDENYLDKDLEHLSLMFTSMEKWKNDETDFSTLEKTRIRNLKDTDATKRLYNLFHKRLKKQNLLVPFKIDMMTMAVLTSTEFNGIRVDTKELNSLTLGIDKELERLTKLLPLNPRSSPQICSYFDSLGIKSFEETSTGAPSWNKKVLETLVNQYEGKPRKAIRRLLKYKKYFGLKSKFLETLSGFLDSSGLVHPTFNQVKRLDDSGEEEGVVTARLSCKNPNLMFIPREREDLEYELNPRRLFVPTDPRGFILSADMNQIEIRVAAIVANDELLAYLLSQGGDVHRLIASEVFERSPESITDDQRKAIKKVVFGILYLISARGLAGKIGCSETQAQKYIDSVFTKFPKQEERIDDDKGYIVENQEAVSLFGRKRRLPGASFDSGEGRRMIRQGVNFKVQSPAVDIVKLAMYKILDSFVEENLRSRIFANVHDEIAIDGRPGEEDLVIDIVRDSMKNPNTEQFGIKLMVPMEAKLKIGPNWLNVKEV